MIKVIGMTPSYNDEIILPPFFSALDMIKPKIDYHLFATNNCTDKTPAMIDKYLEGRAGENRRFNLPKDISQVLDEPYVGVGIARQYLLKRAREIMEADKSYTHALCLDTDIYMNDLNALEKITEWHADIIGGSYLRMFPEGKFLATRFMVIEKGDEALREKVFYDIAIPFVTSAGFMCLSRKAVLDERLRFFPIWKALSSGKVNDDTSEDFGFCLNAHRFGYNTYVDGTVKLVHLSGPKQRSFMMGPRGYNEFKY